jgi:hypothetical protein
MVDRLRWSVIDTPSVSVTPVLTHTEEFEKVVLHTRHECRMGIKSTADAGLAQDRESIY